MLISKCTLEFFKSNYEKFHLFVITGTSFVGSRVYFIVDVRYLQQKKKQRYNIMAFRYLIFNCVLILLLLVEKAIMLFKTKKVLKKIFTCNKWNTNFKKVVIKCHLWIGTANVIFSDVILRPVFLCKTNLKIMHGLIALIANMRKMNKKL